MNIQLVNKIDGPVQLTNQVTVQQIALTITKLLTGITN